MSSNVRRLRNSTCKLLIAHQRMLTALKDGEILRALTSEEVYLKPEWHLHPSNTKVHGEVITDLRQRGYVARQADQGDYIVFGITDLGIRVCETIHAERAQRVITVKDKLDYYANLRSELSVAEANGHDAVAAIVKTQMDLVAEHWKDVGKKRLVSYANGFEAVVPQDLNLK